MEHSVTMESVEKKLLILDGNNCLCRAYYGIKPLSDLGGLPCNALYGFTKQIFYLVNKYSPTHLVVTFDRQSVKRKKLYPEYKANRKKEGMEDLFSQIQRAPELLDALGIAHINVPGYEADDLIANMCIEAARQACKTLIYTTDKDLCQLVTDMVHVLRPNFGGGEVELDTVGVVEKFGVSPDNMATYLALCGDASDNIPGIYAIGDKTAKKILPYLDMSEDGVILYKNGLDIKLKTKIQQNEDIFKLSYKLTKLEFDAKLVTPTISLLEFPGFSGQTSSYLETLGFTSITQKLYTN